MNAKQHMFKLAASLVMTLFALAVMVGGTYAWFVLSTEPEVRGMQVSVGGKNTIQVAPDQNGLPGGFGGSISLNGDDFGILSPVSTADGVHWMLPQFAPLEDGGGMTGFSAETDLTHANIAGGDTDGAYAYLDFWVISPEHCLLRLATEYVPSGSGPSSAYQAGSFAVAIPRVIEENGQLAVGGEHPAAEACLRIGFLVDESDLSEAALSAYRNAPGAESKVQKLRGNYPARGTAAENGWAPRFTIYEPNADLRPADPSDTGIRITSPIAADGAPASVAGRLTAQLQSSWRVDLTQELANRSAGQNLSSVEQAQHYVSTQFPAYFPAWLRSGNFVSNTAALYTAAQSGPADPGTLAQAGATEDVYMAELQANVPQRIRMFLWLEGQDWDCVGVSGAASFCVHLELAGDTTLAGLEP